MLAEKKSAYFSHSKQNKAASFDRTQTTYRSEPQILSQDITERTKSSNKYPHIENSYSDLLK